MKARFGVVVLGMLVLAGCTQSGADDPADGEVQVTATEWGFELSRATLEAGTPVTFVFHNEGDVAHNFGGDWGRTETIQSGETDRTTVTFDETGEVEYWCSVSGHRDAGMDGRLVIS